MFNKLLTLLFALFWCVTLTAQEGSAEISPYLQQDNGQHVNAMWDVLLQFDASTLSGAAGNAGSEWNGTYLYSTRWASNLIHEYSADGTTLMREFSIPGVTGLRDLAWDGQYMYGGAAANTIYQMDFATNTLIGTISSPVAVRHIAYDEASDAFWVGTWDTSPTLVSRTGTTLATIPTGLTSQYGSAYDNVSAGGPYLWVFDQGTGGGSAQLIHQYEIATGTATGVTHDVMTDIGLDNALAIAGGLFSMTDYASGFFTIGGLLQGGAGIDEVFVYEITAAGGGGSNFFDDFEPYVAGQQLACQNPVDWTTWSNSPCSPVEDAYISSNYAYSGANSCVVVQNNDLVRLHGDLTTGTWYMEFQVYIPTGKAGYFNNLSDFTFGTGGYWAMEVYFDAGGAGRLVTSTTTNFSWTENTWQHVRIKIDLDNDMAEFWFAGSLIHTWQWTLGASGGTGPLALEAADFFGATATDEMYFDDYWFADIPTPVELTSFAANVNSSGHVVLNWSTASEINNQMFEIERKAENSEYVRIGYVNGYGTTTEPKDYSYVDQTVQTGNYFYRLKQIDFNGSYEYSEEVFVEVNGPLTFELKQNYPNPFNPSTRIAYSVPVTGNVKLAVYNLVGEEVAVLVNGQVEAGFYETTFDASNLPSGLYLYKLQSDNTVEVKKMMLLK